MVIVEPFKYKAPETLGRALKLIKKHGRRAQVLAGGTDLVGALLDGTAQPGVVVDLKRLSELRSLELTRTALHLGALVTFTDLLESEDVRRHFPLLGEMAGGVASPGIRNRATLAGNLCSAVPCCDSGPALLGYGAELVLKSTAGKRRIDLADWFIGPRATVRKPREILVQVRVSRPPTRHGAAFVKLRRYRGEDLAQASVAVVITPGWNYRIAFGAVAPTPVRSTLLEQVLHGRAPDDAARAEAIRRLPDAIAPITDLRATRDYRLHMAGVMLERGLQAAAGRLQGRGPAYGTELI